MQCYKLKDGRVKCVECKKMEYPMDDSEGDTIYDNTHFATEEEAHKDAIEKAAIGVRWAVEDIKRIEVELQKAKDNLIEECKLQQLVLKDYEDYKEKDESSTVNE